MLAVAVVELDEMSLPDNAKFSDKYHLYTESGCDPKPFISQELIELLVNNAGTYIEVRNGVMLAFRQTQGLANAEGIALLFSLAESVSRACIDPQRKD